MPTATSIKVQADTGTLASSDCQAENDKLKAEIQQLRREVYLLNMRKDNFPMGGLLGEWDGPNHFTEAENFGTCYPKAAKAMFCMNGCRGDAKVNPQFLDCESTDMPFRAHWDPPKNPHHAKGKEVSNAPISTFIPIASMTEKNQFEPR